MSIYGVAILSFRCRLCPVSLCSLQYGEAPAGKYWCRFELVSVSKTFLRHNPSRGWQRIRCAAVILLFYISVLYQFRVFKLILVYFTWFLKFESFFIKFVDLGWFSKKSGDFSHNVLYFVSFHVNFSFFRCRCRFYFHLHTYTKSCFYLLKRTDFWAWTLNSQITDIK